MRSAATNCPQNSATAPRTASQPSCSPASRSTAGSTVRAGLLLDALTRATDAIEIAGGRLIVVDAIDEPAQRFYEHHGFHSAPSRPARLFRKASDVAVTLRGR